MHITIEMTKWTAFYIVNNLVIAMLLIYLEVTKGKATYFYSTKKIIITLWDIPKF